MGFRLSEYIAPDGSDDPLFVFLQRKGNPHDIVFAPGAGPRLHHAAFSIPESYLFFYVCDLAATMGFAENIEFGPGRHGPGYALFVYMRDPDGHRIELFNTHYQCMDIEDEPVRWDASLPASAAGSCRRAQCWFTEASRFAGVEPREPARDGNPMTLEKISSAQCDSRFRGCRITFASPSDVMDCGIARVGHDDSQSDPARYPRTDDRTTEPIWFASYPAGVPKTIDPDAYPSLAGHAARGLPSSMPSVRPSNA